MAFAILFRFPEAPVSCGKNIWNNFYCIVLLFVWAQRVCLRFLKSYFKLEPSGFFFSRSVLQKSSFSDEKNYRWNLRHTLIEKLSKFDVAKC